MRIDQWQSDWTAPSPLFTVRTLWFGRLSWWLVSLEKGPVPFLLVPLPPLLFVSFSLSLFSFLWWGGHVRLAGRSNPFINLSRLRILSSELIFHWHRGFLSFCLSLFLLLLLRICWNKLVFDYHRFSLSVSFFSFFFFWGIHLVNSIRLPSSLFFSFSFFLLLLLSSVLLYIHRDCMVY